MPVFQRVLERVAPDREHLHRRETFLQGIVARNRVRQRWCRGRGFELWGLSNRPALSPFRLADQQVAAVEVALPGMRASLLLAFGDQDRLLTNLRSRILAAQGIVRSAITLRPKLYHIPTSPRGVGHQNTTPQGCQPHPTRVTLRERRRRTTHSATHSSVQTFKQCHSSGPTCRP